MPRKPLLILCLTLGLFLSPMTCAQTQIGDKQVVIISAAVDTGNPGILKIRGLFSDLDPYLPIVTVNATRANVVSVTPTQVTVVLPAGLDPGTYLLTVAKAKRSGEAESGEHHSDIFYVTL